MRRICVFLGSSTGRRPEYAETARELGRELLARGYELVYGGASIGLMAELARQVLSGGGEVIGIIPRALKEREVALIEASELRVVESMHERKAQMAELADAFIVLPGGLGTLEEMFEVLTWAQLGFHRKPCGLLDGSGYYDLLHEFLDRVAEEGFMHAEHRRLLLTAPTPSELLDALESYQPPAVEKILDRQTI